MWSCVGESGLILDSQGTVCLRVMAMAVGVEVGDGFIMVVYSIF